MKAFIIGRPYHLFNSINYAVSNKILGDAFILNEYANARNDYINTRDSGIFRKVYFVEESSLRPKKGLKRAIFAVKRGVAPEKVVFSAVKEPAITKDDLLSYDEVYSATPGSFVLSLISITKASYFVLEDGAGTYSGKNFLAHQSLKHKLYCMIFQNGALNLKVEGVYVYRPDMCKTELSDNVLQLPIIDIEQENLINSFRKVFNIENDKYSSKVIFLSQRMKGFNIDFNLSDYMTQVFESAGIDDYCYRLHPAESNGNNIGAHFDAPNEMWELLCSNYVKDETILITVNSSAAFSPAKLYGKNPFVIFLYRIIGLKGEDLRVSEEIVEALRCVYDNPAKIFIPDNKDELIGILHSLNYADK